LRSIELKRPNRVTHSQTSLRTNPVIHFRANARQAGAYRDLMRKTKSAAAGIRVKKNSSAKNGAKLLRPKKAGSAFPVI
jgi:hypothetical protein